MRGKASCPLEGLSTASGTQLLGAGVSPTLCCVCVSLQQEVTSPFCASVSPSGNGDGDGMTHGVVVQGRGSSGTWNAVTIWDVVALSACWALLPTVLGEVCLGALVMGTEHMHVKDQNAVRPSGTVARPEGMERPQFFLFSKF